MNVIPRFIAMWSTKIGMINGHVAWGSACGGIRMMATHMATVVIIAVSSLWSTLEIGIDARGNEKARIIALPVRIDPVADVIALAVGRYMRIPITMKAGKFSTPRLAPF